MQASANILIIFVFVPVSMKLKFAEDASLMTASIRVFTAISN